MRIFLTVLSVLFLLSAWIVLLFCFRRVFRVKRSATMEPIRPRKGELYAREAERIETMIRAAAAIPFEPVTIRSHDGLTLFGRYYETAPGAPLQIQVHGYRSNPYRDFAGGLPMARKLGCNVLLITQRGHERSEGNYLSFGILERRDCLSWISYANARFGADTPVFLAGVSMGAATVLMTSDMNLPENVRGIIADCGYSSPEKILCKVMKDVGYPVKLFYPLIRISGRLFGGFDVEAASPEDSLTRSRIPVLLIHGEEDSFVPCDMSRENFRACASRKQLLTVPGAEHAMSFLRDERAYTRTVSEFLASCLHAD